MDGRSRDSVVEALLGRRLRLAAVPLCMGLPFLAFPFILAGPYSFRGVTLDERLLEAATFAIGGAFLIVGAAGALRAAVGARCPMVLVSETHLELPWALRSRKVKKEDIARVLVIGRRKDVPEHLLIAGLAPTRHDTTAVTLFGLLNLAPVLVVETRGVPIIIPRLYDEDPAQLANVIARWANVPVIP